MIRAVEFMQRALGWFGAAVVVAMMIGAAFAPPRDAPQPAPDLTFIFNEQG